MQVRDRRKVVIITVTVWGARLTASEYSATYERTQILQDSFCSCKTTKACKIRWCQCSNSANEYVLQMEPNQVCRSATTHCMSNTFPLTSFWMSCPLQTAVYYVYSELCYTLVLSPLTSKEHDTITSTECPVSDLCAAVIASLQCEYAIVWVA